MQQNNKDGIYNIKKSSLPPLISVITICYQAEKSLEKTIESVIGQSFLDKEYIVIDGGSTDKTLDIIKKYENFIDFVISERDKGIYDAMNKGVRHARGEWICFMNAGDIFISSDVLEKVASFFHDPLAEVIYGDHVVDYGFCKVYRKASSDIRKIWKGMIFSHQAVFVKRSLHEKFPFRLDYKIASDFCFFYGLFLSKANFVYASLPIAIIEAEGVSNIRQVYSVVEHWKIVKKRDSEYRENSLRIIKDIYYVKKVIFVFILTLVKKLFPKALWEKLICFINSKNIRGE